MVGVFVDTVMRYSVAHPGLVSSAREQIDRDGKLNAVGHIVPR
jgi:hypothetical protein